MGGARGFLFFLNCSKTRGIVEQVVDDIFGVLSRLWNMKSTCRGNRVCTIGNAGIA
jgi:hypothetical protein